MPKVSVIIPCFNAEKTVVRALNSLKYQNFKDFEIILINDGSTDRTQTVLEKYAKASRLDIRIFCQKNQGVSVARNKGIWESKGKYTAFLDSDDFYEQRFLETLVYEMESKDADIVMSRFVLRNARRMENKKQKIPEGRMLDRREMFFVFNSHRKERIGFFCCLYKKAVIEKNAIQFKAGRRYGEDIQFFLTYAFCCGKGAYFVNDGLYCYVQNPNSAMHQVSYAMTENIISHREGIQRWIEEGIITKKEGRMITARSAWSVVKDFAKSDDDCFDRIQKKKWIKKAMKLLGRYAKEREVKWTALIFLANPLLFKKIVQLFHGKVTYKNENQ